VCQVVCVWGFGLHVWFEAVGVGVFNRDRVENLHDIEDVSDIYQFADELRERVRVLKEGGA